MKRLIENDLLNWKNKVNHKPLVIFGARQVGKTFTIKTFAKENYNDFVVFNFQNNKPLQEIFSLDMNTKRIIEELERLSLKKITEKTLIFFDEIQDCSSAITSLKYFYENAPQYNIISAGSLLGVAINRKGYSFPVGKVSKITMRPMNFYEFLIALNEEPLADLIQDCFNNDRTIPENHHEHALSLYRTYLIVGGMPEAVQEYLNTKDFDFVRIIQNQILSDYADDSTKYIETKNDATRIVAIYNSIPYQLARENKKFQYSLVNSSARATSYEFGLYWLIEAGLVNKTLKVNEGKNPLHSYVNALSYKIYLNDVGLLTSKSNLAPILILSDNFGGEYKGALTENYVSQQFVFNEFIPYFWESNGTAELDFVLQNKDEILPIEVKASDNVKAKSLTTFIKKYDIKKSIRISSKNFGFENNIKSVPLYAVWCIK